MTLIEEAIEVAREYIDCRQRFYQDKAGLGTKPSCRDLVRELGYDMRPCCNAQGKAIAIAIIAATWLATVKPEAESKMAIKTKRYIMARVTVPSRGSRIAA